MTRSSTLYQRFFLGKRDLLLLWIGQLASGFGDSLAFMGFLFLVLELTGSGRDVGVFQMIAYVPIILFGLAAGVYVDRRDRRRVMLTADAGRAFALALLPLAALFGLLDIWVAGLSVVTVTTLTTFFNPAYNSSLPIIVEDPARLFKVNALMQSSRQFASIAGPIFAAFGIGAGGPVRLLSANAATYVISFLCIVFIRTPLRTGDARRITRRELGEEIRLGLRSVIANRSVRNIFLLTLGNNLLMMGPAVIGTPLLVRGVFHGTMRDYALVELMYALGMTITGLLLHRLPRVRHLGRLWAIGMVIDGLTFIPYAWAGSLKMVYVVTLIHALGIPLIVVPRATMIQRLLPREMLGRAFGYIDIAVLGITAISAGAAGYIVERIGPVDTLVYGGGIAAVFGVIGLLLASINRISFDDNGDGRSSGSGADVARSPIPGEAAI